MNNSQQYMAEATMAILLMERLIDWRYSGYNHSIVGKKIDYPESAIDALAITLYVEWYDDRQEPEIVIYYFCYCPAQHTPDITFVADHLDVTYPVEWCSKPFKDINI